MHRQQLELLLTDDLLLQGHRRAQRTSVKTLDNNTGAIKLQRNQKEGQERKIKGS